MKIKIGLLAAALVCGSLSVVAQDAKAVMEEAIKGSQQAVALVKGPAEKRMENKWSYGSKRYGYRYVELGCWW